MPKIESIFQKMINDTRFLYKKHFSCFYFPLFKFTIELLYDGYNIPNKYIIPENRVLQYPKIFKYLTRKNIIKKLDPNFIALRYLFKGAVKDMQLLKWCVKNYDIPENATAAAVKENNFAALKFLIKKGAYISDSAAKYAARNGNMQIFEYLLRNECSTEDACYEAAYNGHFDIVRFCCLIGAANEYDITNGAANGGHLDILKYGHEHGCELYKFCGGYLHILKWLIQNNHYRHNTIVVDGIAEKGSLDCLQFLHSKGYNILSANVFSYAVISRNINLIKWLYEIGCPFDKSATDATIYSFFHKSMLCSTILQLLLSWGCDVDDHICADAARYGEMEILKILYAHGCTLYDEIIDEAAFNGHLHIIIWALEHGCKWSATACENAALGNHLKILKWLRGINRDDCDLIYDGDKICPWNSDVCMAAIGNDNFDVLIFAIEHGCKFTGRCYYAATGAVNAKIVRYAEDNYHI